MPGLSIASWNINSVRLRADQVRRFVEIARPDVLCLQEIKCRAEEFPRAAFADMGLPNVHIVGQKGWHGVAIATHLKLEPVEAPALCPHEEARVAAARIEGLTIHNLYVPAGGDVADPDENPKFAHKLAVLARMRAHYGGADASNLVVVGDLNIAPGEHDVWSHKQLLDVVSHTPVETDALNAIQSAGAFTDIARKLRPEPQKLFTWWSYRAADWKLHNRGRRLDHIWASADVADACTDFDIHTQCRDWTKPSDHVPIMAKLG